MKLKIVIPIALLLLTLCFLGFSYSSFKNRKEVLKDTWMRSEATRIFNDYLLNNKVQIRINDFVSFSKEKYPSVYEDIVARQWDLGCVVDGDSVLLYEYGFDGTDNGAENLISINEYNYITYLFGTKGDLLVMKLPIGGAEERKDELDTELQNEIDNFKIFSDSLDLLEGDSTSQSL